MDGGKVSDDDVVYCRIPPSTPWFEPPNTVTSANYKLDRRRNEKGLSVYRKSAVSATEVLAKPGAIPGSFITAARVGDIRELCNGEKKLLHLDVIRVDDEDNLGHCEIRGPEEGKLSAAASKALCKLFKLDDENQPKG